VFSFLSISRASGLIFMFCFIGLIFGNTKGVKSNFHVLCSWTCVRRYRGCQVKFSCFSLPDTFSAVLRASGQVFMFYAPILIFSSTEGAASSFFMFYAPEFVFSGTKDIGPNFNVFLLQTHFQWYLGHQVQFSCFALLNSFLAVPRVSSSIFMFYALRHILGGTEGVGSTFHVL
jgi:hypothetical protein